MIRSKDELITMLSERIGEDNSDEAIALLEDFSDTFDDYESRTADSTNWKEKYEANDKEWRDKYKERFMSGESSQYEDVEDDVAEENKLTFDSLFKEG